MSTQRFRKHYRCHLQPRHYSGLLHLAAVYIAGITGIAGVLHYAPAPMQLSDLWMLPFVLVVGSLVEYAAHRGPMHHRTRALAALHERHTRRHHRYFRPGEMHFESAQDFHAVLFPPLLLVFFGAIAALIGLLLALILPASTAALFVACALGYYLLYETLHFLYHVPPHWRVAGLPGIAWLARLHHRHHDPRHMQQVNFNLVLPLADWLMGTLDDGRKKPRGLSQTDLSQADFTQTDKPASRHPG